MRRRMSPPEPPEPADYCWWCGEPLRPDDRQLLVIEDDNGDNQYPCCGDTECLEVIGLELDWKTDFWEECKELGGCEESEFEEYVKGRGARYIYLPTEKEIKMNEADLRVHEMKLKQKEK